jgi:hypothetical protein
MQFLIGAKDDVAEFPLMTNYIRFGFPSQKVGSFVFQIFENTFLIFLSQIRNKLLQPRYHGID